MVTFKPQKIPHEHTSLDVLALAAEPRDGANVVRDHHEGGRRLKPSQELKEIEF